MKSTVGTGGQNIVDDVREVQGLLNERIQSLDLPRLPTDGRCTAATVRAIRRFEMLALGMKRSDGRIEPNSNSYKALAASSPGQIGRQQAASRAAMAMLSSGDWWVRNADRYGDSLELSDLSPGFELRLRDLIAALRRGGATVVVRTTRHNAARAHIAHWAWRVAEGMTAPRHVPDHPGVPVLWDHGEEPRSRLGARYMLTAMGVESLVPVESAQIDGMAVELSIDWSGAIRVIDAHGTPHMLDRPRRAATNLDLHRIARSFGVNKDLNHPLRWLARTPGADIENYLIDA